MKSLSLTALQEFVQDKGKLIFSPLDLERYFNVSYDTARKFILRNAQKGILAKMKKGLYFIKNFPPSELEIANRVYSPSYVSFEYALSYYGIIPETVYSITSATTKTSREFTILNITYEFHKIKKNAFTGYEQKEIAGQIIYIADQEKAFADYLYFVDLKKKAVYDRIDIKKLNYEKIMDYIKLFERPSLYKTAKNIYDQARRHKEIIY